MSISKNEYIGKHASRRGNSILIVLILSIKNIFIVDAKVKELVYSGNTVFFLLPSRECMYVSFYTYITCMSLMFISVLNLLIFRLKSVAN